MRTTRKRPSPSRPRRPKRRRRYRINVKRVALTLVIVMLVSVGLVYAFTSPVFSVKTKRVAGLETIPEKDVLSKLDLPPDANIFLVNKKAISDRIMKNPVVGDVKIFRVLPGTISVRVTERRPEVVLDTAGALYHVDADGVPFRILKQPDPGLPVIACALKNKPVLGRKIESPTFQYAMSALFVARENGLVGVGKITVDLSNDLCLNVRDRFQVKLGRPEQLSEKLGIAARLVAEKPGLRDRLEYIDVTCPEATVYKLRD